MTCGDRRDQMMDDLLGLLEPEAAQALHAHLATGCPACQAARTEAAAVLGLLPQALAPVAPPSVVRARVLAAVAATSQGRAAEVPPLRVVRHPRWTSWLMATAAAVAAAAIIGVHVERARHAGDDARLAQLSQDLSAAKRSLVGLRTDNGHLADALSEESMKVIGTEQKMLKLEQEMRTVQQHYETADRAVHIAQDTIAMLRSQNLRLVALTAQPAQPASATARALVDGTSHHVQLITSGLHPTQGQSVYELWMIPSGGKPIPCGTFHVDAHGDGILTTPMPAGLAPGSVAAITEEPGAMPSPTGPIGMKGSL